MTTKNENGKKKRKTRRKKKPDPTYSEIIQEKLRNAILTLILNPYFICFITGMLAGALITLYLIVNTIW